MNIHSKPEDIERTSMAIIEAELERMGLKIPQENLAVVKRAIHTTADFDYAKNLRFTPDAVRKGIAALAAGAVIVTDTNMALAGISKPTLARAGASAHCYMSDEETARLAKERSVTRAVISMERAAKEHPGAIFAIGNAPTALIRLSELMEDGLQPSLVIGVPVGFVNVVESKERALDACQRLGIPAIIAMGRKGGSTVAAAVCNALMYQKFR